MAGYVALELRRSIDEIEPQQALAAAVIEMAVQDGLHGSGELRDEARAWPRNPADGGPAIRRDPARHAAH